LKLGIAFELANQLWFTSFSKLPLTSKSSPWVCQSKLNRLYNHLSDAIGLWLHYYYHPTLYGEAKGIPPHLGGKSVIQFSGCWLPDRDGATYQRENNGALVPWHTDGWGDGQKREFWTKSWRLCLSQQNLQACWTGDDYLLMVFFQR